MELPALACLENSPQTYDGRNVVATLATSFLIGTSSFFLGNNDMHKGLDELEFRPDSTLNHGIICMPLSV